MHIWIVWLHDTSGYFPFLFWKHSISDILWVITLELLFVLFFIYLLIFGLPLKFLNLLLLFYKFLPTPFPRLFYSMLGSWNVWGLLLLNCATPVIRFLIRLRSSHLSFWALFLGCGLRLLWDWWFFDFAAILTLINDLVIIFLITLLVIIVIIIAESL